MGGRSRSSWSSSSSTGIGSGGGSGGGAGGGVIDDEVDVCSLSFDAPLQSVQHPAITKVSKGDVLPVDLRGTGAKASVVCVLPGTQDVVGSLTTQGIARLIQCIEQGNRYVAKVIRLDGSDCVVKVTRSVKAP